MGLWQKAWEILFWLSLPILGFIVWRLILMEQKFQRSKRQIQRDLHPPSMEETWHLLGEKLKQHSIKVDDKHYEKN